MNSKMDSVFKKDSTSNTKPTDKRLSADNSYHPFAKLQQSIGNRAMYRLLQAKLKVSQPGDVYEQEADRAAEQAMGMQAPVFGNSLRVLSNKNNSENAIFRKTDSTQAESKQSEDKKSFIQPAGSVQDDFLENQAYEIENAMMSVNKEGIGMLSFQGKLYTVDNEKLLKIQVQFKNQLLNTLNFFTKKILDGMEYHRQVGITRDESFVVSRVSDVFALQSFPELSIWDMPLNMVDHAYGSLKSGQFRDAAVKVKQAADEYRKAFKAIYEYTQGTDEGAGRAVYLLEAVRDLSFATVGICATVLTGGVGGAVIGTAVSTTGSVAQQSMEQHIGLREEIDWSGIAFDAFWGLFLNAVAGKLGESFMGWVLKNKALSKPLQKALTIFVQDIITGKISTHSHLILRAVFDNLRGSKTALSVEGVFEAIKKDLLDPRSYLRDLLMGEYGRRLHGASTNKMSQELSSTKASSQGEFKQKEVKTADTGNNIKIVDETKPITKDAGIQEKPADQSETKAVQKQPEKQPQKELVKESVKKENEGASVETTEKTAAKKPKNKKKSKTETEATLNELKKWSLRRLRNLYEKNASPTAKQLLDDYFSKPVEELLALEKQGDRLASEVLDDRWTTEDNRQKRDLLTDKVTGISSREERMELDQALDKARSKTGVEPSGNYPSGEKVTEGMYNSAGERIKKDPDDIKYENTSGVLATGKVKIPGMKIRVPGFNTEIFLGASSSLRGMLTEKIRAVKGRFKHKVKDARIEGHAEEHIINQVDIALQENGLDANVQGTVKIRVEQEVCSSCRAGLRGDKKAHVDNGTIENKLGDSPLVQFSKAYPLLIIEITAKDTTEILRIQNGCKI